MLFSEPYFLCWFLPVVLLLYWLAPTRLKNPSLLLASLYFYAYGEQGHVWIMVASIMMNYMFGLLVERGGSSAGSRLCLSLGVAANLLLLGFYKYANFTIENLNSILPQVGAATISFSAVRLPIGISFYTFHGLSYVIDVFRQRAPAQRDPLVVGLYISLFPQLVAGPIVRYVDVVDELQSRRSDVEAFACGVRLFVVGLAKKMIVANAVARPADAIFDLPGDELTVAVAWLGAVCYAVQIYFDFSGYSDMALGLGRMFGIHFRRNFDYPYCARSVTEFWKRWHISLSTWFRDYLYIPLGGSRVSQRRMFINLAVVFVLCGLWHGARWTFVGWGIYHGALLIVERWKLAAFLARGPRLLRHVYTLLCVLVGWVLFRAETVDSALAVWSAMAGLGDATGQAIPFYAYLDPEVAIALALGGLGSTPVLRDVLKQARLLPQGPTHPTEVFDVLCVVVTFLYCAMLVAAGSYSPFIYFRF